MVRLGSIVRIDFHPDATKELTEAADWYLRQSVAAARRFAIEIDRTLEMISLDPERFAQVGRNWRGCSVQRFPFQIVFRFDGDRIRVIAVAHAKRRPNYWQHRS